MINFFCLLVAIVGAFCLGSILTPPSAPQKFLLPTDNQTVPSHDFDFSHAPGYFWHSKWARFTDFVLELYHPRSPIGRLVVEMHDPAMRTLAKSYLSKAWAQITTSTATISPEAATKLRTDLEPFAEQTLEQIEDRLEQ